MSTILYTLHSLATLAQLVGGGIVFWEARTTLKNITTLKEDLEEAEEKKKVHRQYLQKQFAPKGSSNPWKSSVPRQPTLPVETIDHFVEGLGPGGYKTQQALRTFLTNQFPNKQRYTWVGVVLLFVGIIVGWLANMLGI